jgi:hypothetical protein
MTDRVRLCARCKEPIDQERLEAVPKTRLCIECAAHVDETYGGEFRSRVKETKTGRPGAIKLTGVDYEVEMERNPHVPLRLDHEEE